MKTSTAAPASAGASAGRVIRVSVRNLPAPSTDAASASEESSRASAARVNR